MVLVEERQSRNAKLADYDASMGWDAPTWGELGKLKMSGAHPRFCFSAPPSECLGNCTRCALSVRAAARNSADHLAKSRRDRWTWTIATPCGDG
jgi:hypothetical protein